MPVKSSQNHGFFNVQWIAAAKTTVFCGLHQGTPHINASEGRVRQHFLMDKLYDGGNCLFIRAKLKKYEKNKM